MSSSPLYFNYFVDPKNVWQSLKETKILLLPLLIILATAALAQALYFSQVDIEWFVRAVIIADPNISADEASRTTELMSQKVLVIGSVTSTVLLMLTSISLFAVYLHLVAKVQGAEKPFIEWFRFATWGHYPTVLTGLTTFLLVGLSNSERIASSVLNATSFNALFFKLSAQHPWMGLLDTISVMHLFQIGLMAAGYGIWANKSYRQSVIVIALPFIAVFGIWALFI